MVIRLYASIKTAVENKQKAPTLELVFKLNKKRYSMKPPITGCIKPNNWEKHTGIPTILG